jgi:hypothetical protein
MADGRRPELIPMGHGGEIEREARMTRRRRVKGRGVERVVARDEAGEARRCGLCGKSTKALTRTECCGRWICDDEDEYVMFSYARNSCSRNHRRYTLCGFHHVEGHTGDWKTCAACRKAFSHELETYVYYGTNEYNFEKLENPPAYAPTHCAGCGRVIVLSRGGYAHGPDGYRCEECLED